MKIGFFDSGLGGLTILRAVRERMPTYDYLYYGDTKNLPYGDKTEAEISSLTKDAVTKMFDAGARIIIIACNTASVESLRMLQDSMLVGPFEDRRLLGVVIPTVEELADKNIERTLLIGTERTVSSGKYGRELKKIGVGGRLKTRATPELVPLIEKGLMEDSMVYLDAILTPIKGEIDTLVLGCTHYTLLKEGLRGKYGFEVISQDEIIPKKLQEYLERHTEIETALTRTGTVEITLSREDATYPEIIETVLNAVRE